MIFHPVIQGAMQLRCNDCAAVIMAVDQATHEAWHEDIDAKIAKAAKTAGRPTLKKPGY